VGTPPGTFRRWLRRAGLVLWAAVLIAVGFALGTAAVALVAIAYLHLT
jgi:hypothetical protein